MSDYFGAWRSRQQVGRSVVIRTRVKAYDLFRAGFAPMDLLFRAIAGYEGFALTRRGVARVRAQRAAAASVFAPGGPAGRIALGR
ncbi:MAG: hypothetical protein HY241_06595 [Actinobacteria bacterium]|nr:hypothetical protein [Actinomycetota bacterium]